MKTLLAERIKRHTVNNMNMPCNRGKFATGHNNHQSTDKVIKPILSITFCHLSLLSSIYIDKEMQLLVISIMNSTHVN